jgi:hypothetical protein
MSECFVNYPLIPSPDSEVLGEGTSRIQVRIDEDPFFIVRSHGIDGKKDRVFPLPEKPQSTPPWEYALTLPGNYKGERGLVFVLGSYWGFWSFETESQRSWKGNNSIPNKYFLMAALETDKTPFDKFCRELLLAEKILMNETKQNLSKNNWSQGMHCHWLEILLETQCSKNKEHLSSEDRILKPLKMDEKSTKELIGKLRRGTIVSMAQRATNELIHAPKIIESCIKKKPKDNKWMSLLEIVNFEQ